MMRWFGDVPFAPVCHDTPRVPVPSAPCTWCHELIEPHQHGFVTSDGSPFHHECFIRQVIGSVAHQEGRCSCRGGNADDEDDGLSRRDAAIASYALFVAKAGPWLTR